MKNKKKLIIGALVLILTGIIMLGVAAVFGGRPGFYVDGMGIHTYSSGEKKPYILEKTKIEEFKNIDMAVEYADLTIIPSDGYYLEYKLNGNSQKPVYSVENQKFVFNEGEENRGFNLGTQINFFTFDIISYSEAFYYVNLYIPKEEYYTWINIQNDSGKTAIDTINAETLNITAEYGNLDLGTFKGNNLDINMDSGSFHFSTIDADTILFKNSYGKVKGGNLTCDSADISMDSGNLTIEKANIQNLKVESEYGDVTFDSISCKKGEIKLDSGNLELIDADITELIAENSYGRIKMDLRSPLSEYDLDLETDYGKIDMDGYHSAESDQKYETHNNKGKFIKAYCDSGNIILSEKK